MNKIKSVTTVALISIVALSITGCGGSGGSSSNTRDAVVTGFQDSIATANANTDSIVQSNAGTTVATSKTDLVFTNGAAGTEVTFTSADVIPPDVPSSNSLALPSNYNNGEVITRKGYEKTVNGDTFVVGEVLITYDENDANGYLSLGIWVFDSNDALTELGVFAGGGDRFTQANLAGLTGTASYSGEAGGLVVDNDNGRALEGNLSLAANFDDNTISGAVTGITATDVDTDVSEDIADTLNLNSASIDTSVIGGAWTGTTSFTDETGRYTGNWGGQFLGNGASATDNPEYAVGTFSLQGSGDDNFVAGVFHAKKN
ncbi:hypothetical protein SPBRAN_322 [uncultured Candidatus Thioglobus sp.]|nr:hypothetical protein SPBRAN_322 [uncultured Candidatus Thioglobus sp.]